MADQSVRACHPSKFYYFRRSLLISCCYILSPFTSRPPPSARLPSRPYNSLPSPFIPFSFSFSRSARLVPSSSTSFHLLVIPLLFTLRAGSIFDSRRDTQEKDKRGRKRETRAPTSVLLSARKIKHRRNLEHVCSGLAAAASSHRFTL